MRTTIDLDERALAIARSTAAVNQISLGRAVSQLILAGQAPRDVATVEGLPLFSPVPGHVITDDMVASLRDDQ